MCRWTGRGGAREVAELVCVLVVVGKGECAEVEVDACVCGVVLGPFERPGVGVCHAEAEDGVVLGYGVVGERLFWRRRDGVGKGKRVVRGRREVGRGLGLDRGRRGGRGGREERFWVCDAEAVSVRIKGHLGSERGGM